MPTPGRDRRSRSSRRWLRRAGAAAALAAGFLAGCKSASKGGGMGGGLGGNLTSRNTDPLMGGSRIPPQDLPIPGREAYGARDKRDPLLDSGRPAGRGEKTERTENENGDKKDATAAALPASRRPAFRPGRDNTPAALAARLAPDDSELSIGTRPAGGGGPVPFRRADDSTSTGGLTYDQIVGELRGYGAEWQNPDREDGQYVFRCNVPLAGGLDGRVRRYEGTGETPAAAAKQVLDQVRSDTPK